MAMLWPWVYNYGMAGIVGMVTIGMVTGNVIREKGRGWGGDSYHGNATL